MNFREVTCLRLCKSAVLEHGYKPKISETRAYSSIYPLCWNSWYILTLNRVLLLFIMLLKLMM